MIDAGVAISMAAVGMLVLFSGVFSGAETGLTAITRARIYKLQQSGNKNAKMVHYLRNRKEALIGTILLGNNIVNIGASALATSVAIKLWGQNGVLYVTGIMTCLVLVFGEVLPKTYAINNPERVALKLAPFFMVLTKLFAPITGAVQWFINAILRIVGVNLHESHGLVSASDALRGTIELHHRDGHMVKDDRDMLGGILDLSDLQVGEIMVHRTHMETIDADLPSAEIIRLAIQSGHSRLPLWQDEQDNIIGVLHIRDLLRTLHERGGEENVDHAAIIQLLIKPWFVPETTSLRDQLHAFRLQRQHFALVVDEYGALEGMLTLEDILEEIVGEIDDEHDAIEEDEVEEDGEGGYLVDGSMTIRDLNRALDWYLPDEHANTIAGLLLHEARLIPSVGDEYTFHSVDFRVLEREGNQIKRLRLEMKDTPNHGDEDDG